MKKFIILVLLGLLAFTMESMGQTYMRLNVPAQVKCGEEFRIQYIVNTSDVSSFIEPNMPSSIEVVYGPSSSVMSSYQIINGKKSSNSSVTYTYIARANKVGTVVIPEAKVRIKGKTLSSKSRKIQIYSDTNKHSREQNSKGSLSGKEDLFILANINKKEVYEQEPIVLTYKVFTRADLKQLAGKVPDLKGFLIQEVALPQQKTFHVEKYNGRNYQSTVWSQYVMFPQQSGELVIPSVKFEGLVLKPISSSNLIDDFFDEDDRFTPVKRTLKTPSIVIKVKKLPMPKPQNFSEGVGQFNISASLSKKEVKTNENLVLHVSISGVGNMKLLQAPHLNLSDDFDVYDPTVTNKTRLTEKGMVGEIIYDYIIIPKQVGKYFLPSISFTYFDSGSKKYVTKQTNQIPFRVMKGKNFKGNDYKHDIFDIHTKVESLHDVTENEKSSEYIEIIYICILMIGVFSFYLMNKRKKGKANVTRQRVKTANRLSRKYLKLAKEKIEGEDIKAFYQELENALHSYFKNRFGLSESIYTTEIVCLEMKKHNVPSNLIEEFQEIISECNYVRYAPIVQIRDKKGLYSKAENLILKMEENLK